MKGAHKTLVKSIQESILQNFFKHASEKWRNSSVAKKKSLVGSRSHFSCYKNNCLSWLQCRNIDNAIYFWYLCFDVHQSSILIPTKALNGSFMESYSTNSTFLLRRKFFFFGQTVVNFINVKRTNFSYERTFWQLLLCRCN